MITTNRRSIISFYVIYTTVLSLLIATVFGRSLGEISAWLFVIPKVITIQLFTVILFNNSLWKLKIFRKWLVTFPDLTGTWLGSLQSSYVNPETNERVDTIACMLVIQHKFKKIHLNLHTGESISYSFSEEINFDPERNLKRLSYSYTNEPRTLLDYRSNSHKGTVILNLIDGNKLKGYYYTDRSTKGELEFTFKTKKLMDKLPENCVHHPMDEASS